jgi:hypothetical protein
MLDAGRADIAYAERPYFFSDQYDLGMEYIGYTPRDVKHRVIVRGISGAGSSWRSGWTIRTESGRR